MITDVVLGGVLGDEAKAKVCLSLLTERNYTHSIRWNGGSNAGHTVYLDGKKVVTHMVPTAALLGIRSIIGPGCVVNESEFWQEIEELKQFRPDIADYVRIAYNAHIVQPKHKEEEIGESKIGTTKKGIGPAYRDKHARTGIRAESIDSFKDILVDCYEEFYSPTGNPIILAEGAQSLGLDINWGTDYPYCTSSHCDIGGLISNGIPHTSLRQVWLVAKGYDTYVGNKTFQDKADPVLDQMAEVGKEYGATTGRRRQTNYLDINLLTRSVKMSCATHLVVNKMDVLKTIGVWKMRVDGKLVDFENEERFKEFLIKRYPNVQIRFSYTPHEI